MLSCEAAELGGERMNGWFLVTFEPVDAVAGTDSRGVGLGGFAFAGEIGAGTLAGALRTVLLERIGFLALPSAIRREPHRQELDVKEKSILRRAAQLRVPNLGVFADPADEPFRLCGPLFTLTEPGTIAHDLHYPAPWNVLGKNKVVHTPIAPTGDPRESMTDLSDEAMGTITPQDSEMEPLEAFASIKAVAGWLSGKRPPTQTAPLGEFLLQEARVAHQRGPNDAPAEGRLFGRVLFRPRTSNVQLAALVRGIVPAGAADDDAFEFDCGVRLGGDGRVAQMRVRRCPPHLCPQDLDLALIDQIRDRGGCALYAATHACFADGWRPASNVLKHIGLTLIGAAVGRPRVLGGWDLARGGPKPLHRLVPAGSVYFFARTATADDEHNNPEGHDTTGDATGKNLRSFALGHAIGSESKDTGEVRPSTESSVPPMVCLPMAMGTESEPFNNLFHIVPWQPTPVSDRERSGTAERKE